MVDKCIVCSGKYQSIFTYTGFDYWRCSSCGLVATSPIPSAEKIEDYYRQTFQDGNYALLMQNPLQYEKVYAEFVDVLRNILTIEGRRFKGIDILDIGCFTGDMLVLLKQEGANVSGLELQKEAVEIANRKLPGCIYQADVFGDKFPQVQFDIITLTGVIEHVIDPMKLLYRIFAQLKPGGIFLMQTPNSGSFLAKLMGKYWPPYTPIQHIYIFTINSLHQSLNNVGFARIKPTWHWKSLPISYIYNNLKTFGPEFQRILAPIYRLFPDKLKNLALPFYIGETIVTARKLE